MGYLKIDNETIYSTDYINLTVEYDGETHEFETVDQMDTWVEDNLQQEFDSGE